MRISLIAIALSSVSIMPFISFDAMAQISTTQITNPEALNKPQIIAPVPIAVNFPAKEVVIVVYSENINFDDIINIDAPKLGFNNDLYKTYRLKIEKGQMVEMTLKSANNNGFVEIGDIIGGEICRNCTFSSSLKSQSGQIVTIAKFIAPKNGEYIARVNFSNIKEINNFNIDIKFTNPPKKHHTHLINSKLANGANLGGTISKTDNLDNYGDPFDEYEIFLEQGQYYYLSVKGNGFEPILEISGPQTNNKDFVINGTKSLEKNNISAQFSAPKSGNYKILISAPINVYGNYDFIISPNRPIKSTYSQPIEIGGQYDYYYNSNELGQFYDLKLEAGKKYWLLADSKDFDIKAQIGEFDNGEFISAQSDDDSGVGTNSILTFNGNFAKFPILRISQSKKSRAKFKNGNFNIKLTEFVKNELNAPLQQLQINKSLSAELTKDATRDKLNRAFNLYKLELTKGQRITLSANSKIDIGLEILAKNNIEAQALVENDDYEKTNPKLRFNAPYDGEYFIKIYANELMDFGPYKLFIEQTSKQKIPSPTLLVLDTPLTKELKLKNESREISDNLVQTFTFSPILNQKYLVTSVSEDFDSVIKIITPSGKSGREFDDTPASKNAVAEFVASEDGIYKIQISGFSPTDIGKFIIKIISVQN
jgi:hypothetical protein